MMRLIFAAVFGLMVTACSATTLGGASSFGEADASLTAPNPGPGPLNPFLANGDAVVKALDAIAQKTGAPLRVTSMEADTMNGLTVNVQEPKNHINVDRYVVEPDGTIKGPEPVKLMSLGGGPITAKTVDDQTFDPKAIAFPKLARMIKTGIEKSNYPDARAANWEIGGIGPDDRRYVYLQSERARPAIAFEPDMSIVRVSF